MTRRPRLAALVVAGLALVAYAVALAIADAGAWAAALGFAASSLVALVWLVALADLVGASWFVVLRPLAATLGSTVAVLVAPLLPVAFALRRVYAWAEPPAALEHLDEGARRAIEHHRQWMNGPFFLGRAALYLVAWAALAWLVRAKHTKRSHAAAAGTLIATSFTLTFAGFDWLMSAQPGWSSAIYGMYLFAGGLAAGVGALAIAAWLARKSGLLPEGVGADHAHALGRVLLVAIGTWAYLAYSQLLLVWIGDMPRESVFFVDRLGGAWRGASWALGIAHFAVPLFALLSRPLKRSLGLVALVGTWTIAAHALDAEWLVLPALRDRVHAADALPFVATSLVVAAAALFVAPRTAPAPAEDPEIAESLEYESP